VLELHGLSSRNHGSGCGAASHHHPRVQFDMTAIRREIIPVSIQSRCAFHKSAADPVSEFQKVVSPDQCRTRRLKCQIATVPHDHDETRDAELSKVIRVSPIHDFEISSIQQRPDSTARSRGRYNCSIAEGEEQVGSIRRRR
jgi:hypothetical protein